MVNPLRILVDIATIILFFIFVFILAKVFSYIFGFGLKKTSEDSTPDVPSFTSFIPHSSHSKNVEKTGGVRPFSLFKHNKNATSTSATSARRKK
jgi:hypothetical protein